jgi:hypothetical protein
VNLQERFVEPGILTCLVQNFPSFFKPLLVRKVPEVDLGPDRFLLLTLLANLSKDNFFHGQVFFFELLYPGCQLFPVFLLTLEQPDQVLNLSHQAVLLGIVVGLLYHF